MALGNEHMQGKQDMAYHAGTQMNWGIQDKLAAQLVISRYTSPLHRQGSFSWEYLREENSSNLQLYSPQVPQHNMLYFLQVQFYILKYNLHFEQECRCFHNIE
jgi:hypothetical protein